jgi:hypothetical protein
MPARSCRQTSRRVTEADFFRHIHRPAAICGLVVDRFRLALTYTGGRSALFEYRGCRHDTKERLTGVNVLAGLAHEQLLTSIQTDRVLSEDEVLQINYITKRRAYRYVAAAEQEWLFPEKHVSTDNWRTLGDGYLLMPEPRLIHMGGEILIGYGDGHSDAFGAYGHKPWQQGYKDEKRERRESEMLERFQAEWALKHGSKYTAYNYEFDGRARESGEQMTAHYEKVRKRYRRR